MKEQNIEMKVSNKAKKYIIEKGTDTVYGARPLRRAIQNILEDKLAEEMLDGKIKENGKIEIDVKEDKIVVKNK